MAWKALATVTRAGQESRIQILRSYVIQGVINSILNDHSEWSHPPTFDYLQILRTLQLVHQLVFLD